MRHRFTLLTAFALLCTWAVPSLAQRLPIGCPAATASATLNFTQGTTKNYAAVPAANGNSARALGTPQNSDVAGAANYVSLGFGGSITLQLSRRIVNVSGFDLVVYETTPGDGPGVSDAASPETAQVQGSQDGIHFVNLTAVGESPSLRVGYCVRDGKFDIGASGFSYISYLRITDRSSRTSAAFATTEDGYDLDGVSGYACTPPVVCCGASGLREGADEAAVPVAGLALSPNPVAQGSELSVTLTLAEASWQKIELIDLSGKAIATLAEGPFTGGTTPVSWAVKAPKAGLYVLRAIGTGTSSMARVLVTD